MGFGIHSITGINHTQDFIYRAETLDVKPTEIPLVFSDEYAFADVQSAHCVNGWAYTDLQNTVQSRCFFVKLLPADDEDYMPEIYLRESDEQLKPISVAV